MMSGIQKPMSRFVDIMLQVDQIRQKLYENYVTEHKWEYKSLGSSGGEITKCHNWESKANSKTYEKRQLTSSK